MKRTIGMIMLVCILSLNIGNAYAMTNNVSNDIYNISNEVEANYKKALIEAGKFENNRSLNNNNNISYFEDDETLIQTFDDNTTISVSETGYAVARIVGDYIEVIEVENGIRNEHKINLTDIKNKTSETDNISAESTSEVAPMYIDYEKENYSFMGHFRYYEMRATDNYRSYRLTIPNERDKVRGTSLTGQQSWERQARNFLSLLDDSIYLGERLSDRLIDLGKDLLGRVADRVIQRKAVKIFLKSAEVFYEYTANGFKAATVTAITSAESILNDYIADVQSFVNVGYQAAEFTAYTVLLFELKGIHRNF